MSRFQPGNGGCFYYIGDDGEIYQGVWKGTKKDQKRFAIGNCFELAEEAIKVAKPCYDLMQKSHGEGDSDKFTFKELCLIKHCLCRKAEQIIKEFQEKNDYLMGHNVPLDIDQMCDNLRNLTAVMRKVDNMSLEACEKEAKEQK